MLIFLTFLSMGLLTRAGEGEAAVTLFFREGEEAHTYVLCITPPLGAVCGETRIVLDTEVMISEGYEVSALSLSSACGEMVLTEGAVEGCGGGIRLLLDGPAPTFHGDEGDTPLVLLTVVPVGGPPSGPQSGSPSGTPLSMYAKDPRLYALGETEVLEWDLGAVPFVRDEPSIETSNETLNETLNETSNEISTEPATDPGIETEIESAPNETASDVTTDSPITDAPWETAAGSPPVGPPTGPPTVITRFMGCQETPVHEGSYGVRFLFLGEDVRSAMVSAAETALRAAAETALKAAAGLTPVWCMEGGGVLRLFTESHREITEYAGKSEITHEAGEGQLWYTCTFYGLNPERVYVFWVQTEEEILRVIYKNGVFSGMEAF